MVAPVLQSETRRVYSMLLEEGENFEDFVTGPGLVGLHSISFVSLKFGYCRIV